MAFSTFIFDTLDSATRLGRYILQELFGCDGPHRGAWSRPRSPCGVPLVVPARRRARAATALFWTLFGTSNQLLAALSLLAITVWLEALGKPIWFTLAPMLFVMVITLWSLVDQAPVHARCARAEARRPGAAAGRERPRGGAAVRPDGVPRVRGEPGRVAPAADRACEDAGRARGVIRGAPPGAAAARLIGVRNGA